MTISNIVYAIICLPRRFSEGGDKSIHVLLMETGYANIRDKITVEKIKKFLYKHSEYVADWMQYSEDKRTADGWYFKEDGSGRFVVGCLADGEAISQSYDDKIGACAIFVKREIDSIYGNR